MTAATESKLRVLVTGGAAGIGNATARSFLLRGAKVVICDADAAGLQRAILEEPNLIGCVTDISIAEAVDVLFRTVESRLGGLDVLVNNAGISGPTSPVEPKGRVRKSILPIISLFEGLWMMANNRRSFAWKHADKPERWSFRDHSAATGSRCEPS
jgi:NAD(P)-dependent dehydrogenase (short-subunit alcohol dehydrogenase family)